MTLADLLRDPLARSVVLVEAVPLSVALEQMSKPSARGARCLHCGDAIEADDVRAQVRMAGNSVCPPLAAALVRAQFHAIGSEVAA